MMDFLVQRLRDEMGVQAGATGMRDVPEAAARLQQLKCTEQFVVASDHRIGPVAQREQFVEIRREAIRGHAIAGRGIGFEPALAAQVAQPTRVTLPHLEKSSRAEPVGFATLREARLPLGVLHGSPTQALALGPFREAQARAAWIGMPAHTLRPMLGLRRPLPADARASSRVAARSRVIAPSKARAAASVSKPQ